MADLDPSRGCLLWSDDLTDKQLAMLMACKGDGTQLGDSVGYELHGADFAVARALERKGLGTIDGIGGFLPPLFWRLCSLQTHDYSSALSVRKAP